MTGTLVLTPRLKAIVDNVIPCNSAVDVGCDHAQVGIYLAQVGKVKNVTVSDINEGPIERARVAVREAGFQDKITCVKTDGLDEIAPCDTVIIAGMGGELIRDILARAEWTKNSCRLILQPMSMGDVLRKYLFENGYKILKESIAIENERVYAIIVATGGRCDAWEDADLYLSDLSDSNATTYLNKVIARLNNALYGMKKAEKTDDEEIRRIENLISKLSARRDGRERK